MTDHKLACPPGVQLYVSDLAHARAVRELWDTGARVPGDLVVQDWPDYGRAWLTAQTVKVDLLHFMHEFWMKTWGEAFRKHVPGCRLLTEGELAGKGVHSQAICDAFVWATEGDDMSDHTVFVVVEMPDGVVIETTVFLDDRFRAGLWFGLRGRSMRRPDESWAAFEDTGYSTVARTPVTVGGVDIAAMVNQADAAVAANMG